MAKKMFTVRCEEELINKMQDLAKQEHRSLGNMLEKLIIEYKGEIEMDTKYEVAARLVLREDKRFGIDVVAVFDKIDSYFGEIYFRHVLSGSRCQEVGQVFHGWTEQNKEDVEKWQLLEDRINNYDNLFDLLGEDEEKELGDIQI